MKKLFVIVDGKLTKSQQGVQAGHAVAQFMLKHPGLWNNEILVYLRCRDDKDLKNWMLSVMNDKLPIAHFQEPYYKNKMTAFAALGEGLSEKFAILDMI